MSQDVLDTIVTHGQGVPELDLAVSYLRVSTQRQLYTAIDIDPDGNSIATQREITGHKADSLNATVMKEFIEPGHSAKTLTERPVFRELLTYVQEHPGIKYVIVYMRSRAFRNHLDAAVVQVQLKKLGIRLVSAKEDFGEGPHAVAMEGMLDIMNGLTNTLQGLDVQTKMFNKAKGGGTVSLAKLGYRNVRIDYEGRQINTIALDEERAPFVRTAWELYATGEYSIERLEATMADLGLTTKPTRRSPKGTPVSASKLHMMLSDPYYTGFVV
jgi:DNA invertase Pin-like site-specific DNA recombinase